MSQTVAPIVILAHTPTEQDLAEQRLANCRPKDDTVDAVKSALGAIEAELSTSVWRLDQARQREDQLLVTGNVPEIKKARAAIETADIAVAQFTRMRSTMQARLVRSEEDHAERLRALRASLPAAEATDAKWRASIERYHKLAAEIAKILEGEADAQRANATLRDAAFALPDRAMPPDMPANPCGGSWSASVALPGHRMPPPSYNAMAGYR